VNEEKPMKTLEATLMILLLLMPAIISASAAANVSFGVKSGDWIEYQFQNVIGLSSGETERIDFLNVSGTTITLRSAVYTQTITETNDTETFDLTSQQDSSMRFLSLRVYVIPAGLNENDSVYLGMLFGNRTIAGETTRSYLGADRSVIYANFSDTEGNNYVLYWDRATGVLLEGTQSFGAASEGVVVSATSLWMSLIPLLVWISIIAAVTLGVLSSRKSITKRLHGKGSTSPRQKKAALFQSAF